MSYLQTFDTAASINVRWYGARGNGAGDDTAAINAAITAALALLRL